MKKDVNEIDKVEEKTPIGKTRMIIRPSRILIENPENLVKYDKLVRAVSVFDKLYFVFKFSLMEYITNNLVSIPRYIKKSDLKDILNDDTEIVMEPHIYDKHTIGVDYKWRSNIVMREGLQQRSLNSLHQNDNSVLNLRTGTGKTTISLKYAADKQVKTLVIVDREIVMKQWMSRIKKYTMLDDDEILYIERAKGIKDVLSDKLDTDKPVVFLMMHRTISNMISKNPARYVKLMSKLKVGLKIIDEAHKEMHSIFRIDSLVDIKHNLYLTATVGRSDYMEEYMLKKLLPANRVVQYDGDVPNYTTFLLDSFNSEPTTEIIKRVEEMSVHGFDINSWCDHIYNTAWDKLYDKISELVVGVRKKTKGKILILLNQLKLIDRMGEYLSKDPLFKDEVIDRYHSKHKGSMSANVLISTGRMFADAIDLDGLEVIINTSPFSSKVSSIQIGGRLRDMDGLTVVYIDLVDKGFNKTLKQRSTRVREFKRIAKKIIKIS